MGLEMKVQKIIKVNYITGIDNTMLTFCHDNIDNFQ